MNSEFSSSGFWNQPFGSRDAFIAWLRTLLSPLGNRKPDLALLFLPPAFFDQAAVILQTIREQTGAAHVVGCSANSVIASSREIEEESALSLGLFVLPGAELSTVRFTQAQVEEWNGAGYWHLESRQSVESVNSWLVFADPFSVDAERWLHQWNEAFPGVPILGGLASGDYSERRIQIYADGRLHESGGVALSVSGAVELTGVISQGCTPFGDTWTITKAHENIILEIGNRPAYQVLFDTIQALTPEEQEKTRANLFVGLAMTEYKDEFERGDFLVRNILDADAETGALAVGALPRPGQTLQFHRRDRAASSEDFTVLLRRTQNTLLRRRVYGGCLCSCNGRGFRLFGRVDHDPTRVQEAFGPMGLTGFFCNGEIGPVGGTNYLHGYTASLALFTEKLPRLKEF